MRRRGLTTASVLGGLRKSCHRQVPGAGRHRPGPVSIRTAFQARGDQESSVLRTQKNYPTYSGLGPTVGLSDLPRPWRVTEAATPHPRGAWPTGLPAPLGSSSEPLPCRAPSKLIASSASVGRAAGQPRPRGTCRSSHTPPHAPALFLLVPPQPEGLSFLTSLEEGAVIEGLLSLAGLLELIREEDLWACGYFLIVCGSNIKANDRAGRLS